MNKIIKIKNAKLFLNNAKNNTILSNICLKTQKEHYKGDQ